MGSKIEISMYRSFTVSLSINLCNMIFNKIKGVKDNFPSGLVVYFVALPLCLGIGLASTSIEGMEGMPNLFAGIIAGIIGGVVVGALSGSQLGVSGPAAGLITIVTAAIITLGSYQAFLLAVFLAGLLQLIGGFFNAGAISNYFPSSVIKGMLAGIGLTLILKEIPHLFGWDTNPIGEEAFVQNDGENTFSEIFAMMDHISIGASIVGIASLLVLVFFQTALIKNTKALKNIPGALIAVVLGIVICLVFQAYFPNWLPESQHFVNLPVVQQSSDLLHFFSFPDFNTLFDPNVYVIAFTIAIVASLETLLSVEATDKLDPEKRTTPTNKELRAQGIGNMLSGLIGGLPITQVIVRSSTNISAGAKSRMSAIVHGFILLFSIVLIPKWLNFIPLASLAAILLMIGYKLASISLFKSMYKLGWEQFLPFIVTVTGVLFTDLLKGILMGMALCLFFVLRKNHKNSVESQVIENPETKIIETHLILSEETTFLNKGKLQSILFNTKANTHLFIDGRRCVHIDYDVLELIRDFKKYKAQEKAIVVNTINFPEIVA
jgi:carbonic anhydrase